MTEATKRVLIVATPFVSMGGVYTSLKRTIPELERNDLVVGVLWGARVTAQELPGTWTRRVEESGRPLTKGRVLRHHLEEAVGTFEPDILLSVLPQSDVACASVSRRLGVPWIAMIRGRPYPTGSEAPALKKFVWRRSVRIAYRRADWTLFISHALANETKAALGVRVDEVLHNGVDLDGFPKHQAHADRPARIGFVGRLTEDKAPDVVCDIAAALDRDVHIIGDGPLRPKLQERASSDGHVHMLGWKSPSEAMAELDILIVPSRREGLGNVILEAGASGLAVVARDVGGIPEILRIDPFLAEHCLVPEGSGVAEFATAVERQASSLELRRETARRLRNVVISHFTVELAAANLAHTIRSVAVAHAARRVPTQGPPRRSR